MIGGNNSQDMYRQYIFRAALREALESSRHQTTKIHAYITKFKEIFLDCQLIRTAEMFRANFEHVTEKIPNYNATMKVNLVVLHTRAKSADFSSDVLQQRAALLRTFFSDSRRIRVSSEDDLVVFPLADIKPRKDGLSGAYAQSAPPVERILDAQEIVDFDKSMRS
ncbi:hypothetical protein KIN20_002899 [Parelaphostrongylus tenuis]|uniref:Uncharacterized protein n=1 Tax=Parelaphostrongylus tenuis TaxID=148309 RepID=A0AAD5MEV4_PARTN|nr:hypothetical protein KIN20_002899 [Parelaphostrongylus tenuis]